MNTTSKTIYVYNQEVENPGENNDSTVLGIDTDNDLVRDDIQRWISYQAKGDEYLKELLKKLVRTYRVQLVQVNDKQILIEQEELRSKVKSCLDITTDDKKVSEYYSKMIKYFFISTDIRSSAWNKVQGGLAGESYPPAIDDLNVCSTI